MRKNDKPIPWLPIDSRLILPFLSFGHVRGFARLFLQIEMLLAILVVVGALIVAALRFVA